jgi:hypothetical protein
MKTLVTTSPSRGSCTRNYIRNEMVMSTLGQIDIPTKLCFALRFITRQEAGRRII